MIRYSVRCAGSLALTIAVAASLSGCMSNGKAAGSIVDRVNSWTVPGVLRIEAGAVPDNLNPLIGQLSVDTDLSMFWSGHLFNWSDEGKMIPDLATELPSTSNGGISADGRTIVYHLRHGVLWQDGKPFSADDVIFTWRAIMNPRNDIPVREGYDLITGIDAPDAYTLIVHLKHPYAPFLTTFFSMSSTAYAVLPKHLLEKYADLNDIPFDRMPVGTGPFRVVFNDGKRVQLAANPTYWRGAPQLKEVDFTWQTDSVKTLRDLKDHRIDFYYQAYERQEPVLHGIPGTTIYLYAFNSFEDIGFNTASPLVSDKRVRQALAYATDRVDLLSTIGNGVNVSADTDQAPSSWALNKQARHYRYDPAAARTLLDAAGWIVGPDGVRAKNGRKLRLTLVGGNGSPPPGPIERLIQANWRAVGVDSVIHNYDDALLGAPASGGGIEATGKFDAVIEGWVNGVDPDDSSQFMCRMRPPAGWNTYRYCNPKLDKLEEQALSSYDQATRKRSYTKIQSILSDDVPLIVLYFQQQQDVVNLDLKNYYPASAVTPFWNTWQLDI